MTHHIPYRDLILIACLLNPAGFADLVRGRKSAREAYVVATIAVAAANCVIFLSVLPVYVPAPLRSLSASGLWLVPIAVAASLGGQMALSAGLSGRSVRFFRVERKLFPALLLTTGAAGVFEELNFRGLLLPLLTRSVGWAAVPAVVLCGIAYGFNHISQGSYMVLGKSFAGFCYGAAFLLSGYSIIVPCAAHLIENVCVLTIGRIGGTKAW